MYARVSLKEQLCFIPLYITDIALWVLSINYRLFVFVFHRFSPIKLDKLSRFYAKRAFYRAQKKVPAYQTFLAGSNISNVPETDKNNYIRKFSIQSRCVNGKIPLKQVVIDESSGSTGIPNNWVRTHIERKHSQTTIRHFTKYCFGNKPQIVINAFSLGSWATGMNMGAALENDYIVKNTGPDLQKIMNTLSFFGTQYRYLILGYPPFIKFLVDTALAESFPIKDYNLFALVGGEGMSEGLRDYLAPYFKLVYSGYGATDIEIGVAGETPLSVIIRRLARSNELVRKKLFGDESRLPMLFQYNPLMHYVEVNDDNELIFTINRHSRLSPRIRYNLHDEGGIARFDEMAAMLNDVGIDIATLVDDKGALLKLPFMWVYGRRDFTISIMGANIYPEDIEQIIYADIDLAKITRSFCQSIDDTADEAVRPAFYFEININPTTLLANKFKEALIKGLLQMNADFKEAWNEYPEALEPQIYLFVQGEGPFAMKVGQIKQIRVIPTSSTSGNKA